MAKHPRIILLHGIGDKPPKKKYMTHWVDALRQSAGKLPMSIFRMAYWADLRTDVDEGIHKQVTRALSPVQRSLLVSMKSAHARHLPWWQKMWYTIKHAVLDAADPLVKQFMERTVEDVGLYFYEAGKRQAIAARLVEELNRATVEKRPVCLISHSMGTVIALDVLRDWPYKVELFVTMGSPLGSAWIQHKLFHPEFPDCVDRWVNVFDREDPVTLPDQRLSNDFPDGTVEEHKVRDNYSIDGLRNPHSWYGYLSTKEVGKAVREFWNNHR